MCVVYYLLVLIFGVGFFISFIVLLGKIMVFIENKSEFFENILLITIFLISALGLCFAINSMIKLIFH